MSAVTIQVIENDNQITVDEFPTSLTLPADVLNAIQILDVGNTLTPINTINTITPVDEPAVNLSVTTIENVVQTNITTNSVSVTQADVIVEVVAEGVQNILETHNYTVEVLAGGFGGDGITISNINTLAARYDMDFVNTITNSRFKQALEGWQFSGDSGLRLNRDELEVPENCPYQYVARFGTQYAKYVGRRLPIIKGETLYAEVMCATSSGTAPDLSLKINYYDNDNTLLGTQTIATRSASVSWARIKGEATPSASPTYDAVTQAELVLEIATANNTYASAKRWYFTNARMLSGASAEGANARITVEAVTRADADTVLAGLITTISTEVDGALATITEFAESVDGIMAQWGVQVNVGGVITGLIKLSADEDYSVVKIQADKFIISNEAGTEGDSPFEITGGITYIKEAVIPTLTVDKLLVANFGSNLIINPDAEDNLGGWRINARATSTSLVFSRDTGSSNSGDASFKIADNSTHGTMVGARAIPVKAGEILAWSLWVRGSGASTNGLYIRVHELTSKPTTPFIGSTANSLTGIDNATSTTDLITASSAIPNTWTYYSGTYTVPVGVKYVSFSVGNWTASTVDLNFDDVRFRRQLQGVIIEDGTITGTKIAANTITAANIAAGTITATEIAADSITVDQLTISNFGSNLIINPDAEANTAGWKAVARATTTSLILTRDTSDQINGEASFKIADNSTHGTMYGSRAVGVKAGWVLAWSVWIKGASASAAGLYIRVHESSTAVPTKFVGSTANSLTGVDAATSTTDLVTANSAIPNTWTYYSGTYTVPAGIRFVSFSVGNWAASTTDLYFDDVRFRRQIDTVSIENGSIVGSHIAVGTITAAKIAAGTITATEIAADSITVDQLNIANFGSNLISNPDAETNASAWRAIHRATTTSLVMTRDLTQQNNGAASFKIADNSTHGTMYGARAIPVKPGWILAWNVWVKGSTSSTNGLFIRMYELTSKPTTNFIGSTANSLANVDDNTSITNLITADSAIPNVWTYYSGTYTVPAGVAYITFAVGNWTASTADLYFDDVRVRRQIDTLTFEDGSVTGGKIASATITATQIANSTITATQIANSTITATQIANSTITGGKIANTTITASNIQGGTITGTEIASATIANSNIVNSTITGGKIAANTITAANITAGTITATEIAANTITSAQIAAGTITATEIAADSITVDKLVVANFGSNLILNPDAEENLAGWRIVARATTTSLAFTRDTTTVNGGTASFKLADNSTHGSFAGSRAFAVKAGQILAWSVWINGSGASAAGLYIRMYELTSAPSTRFVGSTSNSLTSVDASTSTTELITADSAIPNTWTYYEGTYTVPAGVKYATFAIGNWTASTVDLYFDDVRVRRQIDAVTIEDGVITNAKLVNATITGAKIANTTIAASNIVNSTITATQIANSTITATQIANSTITGGKIAGTTITASNIVNGTITATQISDATITNAKIVDATITGAKIAANTITASNIAAGTITASEIAADSITVDQLNIVNFGSNLIANPDAEIDVARWRIIARATTTSLVFTRDTTQQNSGEASFKIADNSTHGSVLGARAIAVKPGWILSWSVWIKGSSASAAGLYIRMYELTSAPTTKFVGSTLNSLTGVDNNTSVTELITGDSAISNSWTYYSGTYTVPASVKYISFGIGNWTASTADLYFDDVRVRRQLDTITFEDGAVTGGKIASATITASNITNSTITATQIANSTITGGKIAGTTITASNITAATITATEIANSTITATQISNSTITGGKIAGTTITASNITNATITTTQIAASTITGGNIAGTTITASNIVAATITASEIANSTITGGKIAGTTITASNIANSTITTTQIANSTITGGNIAGTTISASNIVSSTITATQIANSTITGGKIANATITGANIAGATITDSNIVGGTITGASIAAGTITASNIAAGTITATEIAADSITVDQLTIANFGSNLISNPDAEENLARWKAVARATTTSLVLSRDTTQQLSGIASFKIADNSTHGTMYGARAIAVKPGWILSWSVWIKGSASSTNGLYIRMHEITSAPSTKFVGSTLNSLTGIDAATSTTDLVTADSAIPNTWTYYSGTYTVPAGVIYVTFSVGNWTASTADLYFDDVRVRRQLDTIVFEDGSVTGLKIAGTTITASNIANSTITATQILNSTITGGKIANTTITASNIVAATITASEIANSTITGGKIAGTTITASNIAAATITASEIANSTITGSKIAGTTITASNIFGGTITATEIANSTITGGKIAGTTITASNIVNATITTTQIANSTITGGNIAGTTISASNIVSSTITATQIANSTITGGKIANATITGANIAGGTITDSNILGGTITGASIAANTITASNIAAGTITASEIAADSITVDQLTLADYGSNLIRNPDAEANIAGWRAVARATTTSLVLSRDTTQQNTGTASFKIADNSTHGTMYGARAFSVKAGWILAWSVWIKGSAASTNGLYIRMHELTSKPATNFVGSTLNSLTNIDAATSTTDLVTADSAISNSWTYYSGSYTVPAGVQYVTFSVGNWTASTADLYFDDVRVRRLLDTITFEDGAVTGGKIASATITASNITNSTITATQIANSTITGAKIAGTTITASNIVNATITTTQIASSTITGSNIAGTTITASNIANTTITASQIANSTITATQISNSTITGGKIAGTTITASNIVAGTITGTEIASATIAASNIINSTITGGKIASATITGSNIAGGTITDSNILGGTITGASIAAGTITASNISAGTITASEIAADSITVDQLNFVNFGSNLIANSDAETNIAGWRAVQRATTTSLVLSRDTSQQNNGAASFKIADNSTHGTMYGARAIAVKPGWVLAWSVWIKGSSASAAGLYIRMHELTSAPTTRFVGSTGNSLTNVDNATSTTDLVTASSAIPSSWTYYSGNYTVPAGVLYITFSVGNWTASTADLYFDDVRVRRQLDTLTFEDGAITGGKIANVTITAANITSGTITATEIANSTITGGKIAGTTITASNIQNATITTTQIANSTITGGNIAGTTITASNIANTTITASQIANSTITATQITNSTITGGKIAGTTITASNIVAGTITATEILNSTITGGKIASATITGSNIAGSTITDSNILGGTITGASIAAGTITAANIAAGTITASEIAADSITVDQLNIVNFGSNLISNPDAEDNLARWRAVARATTTSLVLTRDTTQQNSGEASFKIADNSTHGTVYGARAIAVKAGWILSWSVWVKGSSASTNGLYIRMYELTSAPTTKFVGSTLNSLPNVDNATSTTDLTTANGAVPSSWTYYSGTYTVPASVKYITFGVGIWTASTADLYFDDVRVRRQLDTITFEDGAVTGGKIASATITASNITGGTITATEIANSTITGGKIAGTTITASNIVNATITTTQIANSTITGGNIAGTTITASNIANTTITASQIANSTITATQITNSTITGGKIANTTITGANIVNATITATQIQANTITATEIAAATITATEIAASTITGAKIAATTIAAGNIVSGTITTTQIAATTIVAGNIASSTITATQIAASTITGAKIAANTITASNIAAGTITATEIAAGTITAANISAGSITANEIAVDSITVDKLTFVNFSSNLIRNPDAEVDLADWTETHRSGSALVLSRDTTNQNSGAASFKITDNGANGSFYGARAFAVKAGEKLAWSIWIDGSSASANGLYIRMIEKNAKPTARYLGQSALTDVDNAYTSTTDLITGNSAIPSSWTYYSGTYTVPAGIKYVTFSVANWTASTADLYFDDVRVRRVLDTITIDDDAITNAKILASTITGAKIAGTTIAASNIVSATITTTQIANSTITGSNIAGTTITASNIANSTITGGKIANTTITASNIVGGTITNAEIASATILDANITASTITGSKIANTTIAAGNIVNSTITATQIANSTITGGKIANTTITASNIVGGTITGTELANTTITNSHIVNSTITGGKIAGTTITASNITNATITTTQIANSTITGGNIAGTTITASNIANTTITASQIANSTITATQITNSTITGGKIAGTTITASNILGATITTAEIAASTITGSNIANSTITGGKIAGTTITASNIQGSTITASEIANSTITGGKIANATITGANIAGGTITDSNILGGTITGASIAAGTITASNIAAGTITASEIAADSITVDQLTIADYGANLIRNPDAEANIAGWRAVQRATTTSLVLTRDTTQQNNGAASFKITDNSTHGTFYGARAFGVKAGWILAWSIWIKGSAASTNGLYIRMHELTSKPSTNFVGETSNSLTGVDLRTSFTDLVTVNSAIPSSWTYYSGSYTVPAGVQYVTFSVANWTASTADVYFDDVRVRRLLDTITFEDGAVTGGKIANATITASNITGGTITATEIANSTITGGKIAGTTITASNIVNGTITGTQISNATITGGLIANTTITGANIVNATITATQIQSATITATQIAATTITAGNIVSGTITGTQIAATTIAAANIVAGTITTTQIAATTIVAGNIAASTITATQIAATTITAAKIAANTITAAQIAANTITASQIAAGTITATEIAVNTISASRIILSDSSNLLADVDFADSTYWTLTSGTYDTTAETTTTLGLVRTVKTPVGNGTTSQATSNLTVIAVGQYSPVEAGKSYRAASKILIKNGFTGIVGVIINWYKSDGTTAASTAFSWQYGTDYRTVAKSGGDGVQYIDAIFVAPSDAYFARYYTQVAWSTTLNNAQYALMGQPRINRATSAELIVNGTITGTKIAATTVAANNIVAGTITTTQIAATTIVAGNIVSGTITGTQIAATTIAAGNIVAGTITTTQIAATTIVAGNIAASTITATQIAATTITAAKIVANTITASQIAASTITATEIAATTITAAKIAANTITASQIAAGTITATQIAAGTITAANIAAGSITATELAVGAITASRIVAIGGNNYILDPEFSDVPDYWSLGSGWATDTSTEVTVDPPAGMGAVRGLKTPVGNGTTSQAANTSSIGASSNWFPVDGGAYFRVAVEYFLKSGFTGRAGAQVIWYKADKSTQVSTTTIFDPSFNDYRTTAYAGASTANAFLVIIQAPSTAVYGRFSLRIDWSSTQNNAQYIIYTKPSFRPMLDEALIRSDSIVGPKIAPASIYDDRIFPGTLTGGSIASATITGSNIAGTTIAASNIINSTITGAKISGSTITASNIVGGTITATEIASDAITTIKILNANVTGAKIANTTVAAGNIVSSTITATQIANTTITGAKMVNNTVTATQINAATITTTEIASLTIVAGNIANTTITGGKLVNATITTTQIAAATIAGSNIAATTIAAGNIVSGTITTTQIAASTITGSNIAATTIAAGNIVSSTITATQIANTTITGAKMVNNTVTATQIAAATITATEIANSTITGGKIANNTITAANIAAGTITSAEVSTSILTSADYKGVDNAYNLEANFQGNLVASGIPTGWADWSAGAANTTRVTGCVSKYAAQIAAAAAAANVGILQHLTDTAGAAPMYPGWYRIVGDITLGAGSLTAAGILTQWRLTGLGTVQESWSINFATDADIAGTVHGAGTVGRRYQFAKTFQVTTSTVRSVTLYAMAHWSTFGSTAGAATIIFNRCALERVSDAEVISMTIPANIVAGTITSAEITNGTITGSDIAATTIAAGNIVSSTITATQIANTTITGGKLVNNTITATQIQAATITTTEIAATTIVAGNIANSTITGGKIANTTITAANITASTITATEIANTTITGGKIAATTITGSNLVNGTITATQIAALAITASKHVIKDFNNYIADPLYTDSTYWTFGSGWTLDTSTDCTTTLNVPSGAKTVTGNGTTSQGNSETSQTATDSYVWIEPGKPLRVAARAFVKSGFTGLIRIIISWLKQDKSTSASTASDTFTIGSDYRNVAAGADTTASLDTRITAPSDAVWARYRCQVVWSTTLNNAQYAIFAAPRFERGVTDELSGDSYLLTATAANANTTVSVPAGFAVYGNIFVDNTTAAAVTGGVKIGTTNGGTQVVVAQAVAANDLIHITDANIVKRIFSKSASQTLFIQAVTAWNGCTVNFSIPIRKVF